MSYVISPPSNLPVGKIKTFGSFGEKYQVISLAGQAQDGEWMVKVRMLDSGEEVAYRFAHMCDDPEAQ